MCLKTGEYELRQPLVIAANDVSFHGESTERSSISARARCSRCRASATTSTICSSDATAVGRRSITFIRATDCSIRDCELQSVAPNGGIGIAVRESTWVDIHHCMLVAVELGILIGKQMRFTSIIECTILAAMKEGASELVGTAGILFEEDSSYARIENCLIAGYGSGIILSEKEGLLNALRSIIVTLNTIVCWPAKPSLSPRNMGIGLMVDSGVVSGNDVLMDHIGEVSPVTGIAIGGVAIVVAENMVDLRTRERGGGSSIGLHSAGTVRPASCRPRRGPCATTRSIAPISASSPRTPPSSTIDGNAVSYGFGTETLSAGYVSLRSRGTHFSGNSCLGARFAFLALSGTSNVISENRFATGQAGLLAALESDLRIAGNTVTGYEQAGIFGFACGRGISIDDNRVDWIGTTTNESPKAGIHLLGVGGLAEVGRNKVSNIGFDTNRKPSPGVALGIVVLLAVEAKVQNNSVGYDGGWEGIVKDRGLDNEDRALLMQGMAMPGERETDFTIGYPALVDANRFEGPGAAHLSNSSRAMTRCGSNGPASPTMIACTWSRARTGTCARSCSRGATESVSANYFRSLARPRCVRFETNNAIFIGNFYREKWSPPTPYRRRWRCSTSRSSQGA